MKKNEHLAYNNYENDVVLTPDYLCDDLLVPLLQAKKGDEILDPACGTGNIMAACKRADLKPAGIEITKGLCDIASANVPESEVINGDALTTTAGEVDGIIANPPYSLDDHGLNIIAARIDDVKDGGRVVVLIQENAGQKSPSLDKIMNVATLEAVITMPKKLFIGYANVQTAIYVFVKGKAHKKNDKVKFMYFENDGYRRSGRKKSKTNLTDDGTAKERYSALVNWIISGDDEGLKKFYKNEEYFESELKSEDILYRTNRMIDTIPTEADFEKTVTDYLTFKVKMIMEGR